MPGEDGTGPLGEGPMTGRGLGPCGRGLAKRKGLGRGLGRGFGFATRESIELSKEEQKKILEEEKAAIEKKISEL